MQSLKQMKNEKKIVASITIIFIIFNIMFSYLMRDSSQ